jgi:hypothetical protein
MRLVAHQHACIFRVLVCQCDGWHRCRRVTYATVTSVHRRNQASQHALIIGASRSGNGGSASLAVGVSNVRGRTWTNPRLGLRGTTLRLLLR